MAIALTALMTGVRMRFDRILTAFKIEQKTSTGKILFASLLGIYIHIILDSYMHSDIRPFYPLDINPFLSRSMLVGLKINMLCTWMFIAGLITYAILLILWARSHR